MVIAMNFGKGLPLEQCQHGVRGGGSAAADAHHSARARDASVAAPSEAKHGAAATATKDGTLYQPTDPRYAKKFMHANWPYW
jgi:hypothetical protein